MTHALRLTVTNLFCVTSLQVLEKSAALLCPSQHRRRRAEMLEAMTAWPSSELHYGEPSFGSPSSRACRTQAAFSFTLQHQTPAAKGAATQSSDHTRQNRQQSQPPPGSDAATQTPASVSPPSEQLSDSADSEAALAEERQQQAEPLLQDDEHRFTMYPIMYVTETAIASAHSHNAEQHLHFQESRSV